MDSWNVNVLGDDDIAAWGVEQPDVPFDFALGWVGYLGYEPGSLPKTERASRENLALPLWPGIEPAAQERVVEAVRSAVRERVPS